VTRGFEKILGGNGRERVALDWCSRADPTKKNAVSPPTSSLFPPLQCYHISCRFVLAPLLVIVSLHFVCKRFTDSNVSQLFRGEVSLYFLFALPPVEEYLDLVLFSPHDDVFLRTSRLAGSCKAVVLGATATSFPVGYVARQNATAEYY
jgi:hypothetical protein